MTNVVQEKIQREIHTYEIFHRIQPVIDIEVLPPRHFIPVEGGGLREVSADDLPGQTGHWGIVETVTKDPPVRQRPVPPAPAIPVIVSQRTYMTEEGVRRTETTWKHPPTLATGAMETGQSWPMQICKEAFEARDGIMGSYLPRKQPISQALKAVSHPHHPQATGFSNSSSPTANSPAGVDDKGRAFPASPIPPVMANRLGAMPVSSVVPTKRVMPGSFPSSASTATLLNAPPALPPR